jgi:hypothetical protein
MPKFISNKFTTDIMSLLTQASLIVTPNGYKEGKLYSVIPSDGSGDLSVTRATTATRVNSAGLVELVPYNFKVQSENLTLGVGLDDANITTITANTTETLDPFGGYNAEKYNGSTNQSADTYNFIPQNSVVTSSVYVKAGTATSFTLRLNASFGTFAFATFDLTNGTITGTGTDGFAYISSAVTAVSNGWYRCSLTYNFLSFPTNRILLSQNGSIYVFGWQLVEGSTAKDYQKTETRLNIPRLDYSNGTCPSLLVEPQRTNLLTYSSSFDNADWNKSNMSVTANSTASPSGVQDADTLTKSTAGVDGIINRYVTASASNYTGSVYIKKDSNQTRFPEIFLRSSNDSGENEVYVQLNTATGATAVRYQNGTAVVNPPILVNGYWRVTITIPATSNNCRVGIRPAAGTTLGVYDINATGSVVAWGFQLEAGSYPTSYIPTTSASVTRNADVISKTGISSLIGQTEGTLFVDFWNYDNTTNKSGWNICINAGSYGNAIYFEKYLGEWAGIIWNGFNNQFAGLAGGALSVGRHKMAIAYKTNDIAVYCDGVLTSTDTTATIPACSRLDIGFIANDVTPEELGFNVGAIWKTRLTNDQLEALTGPGFNTYAQMAEYYNYVLQ